MNAQWSRRDFVGLVGAGLAAASLPARAQQPGTLYAYVGSWTQGPFGVGGGGGITVLAVDRASGALTELSHTGPELDNLNAGYLCLAPNGRFLYATNEVKNRDGELGAGGAVLSFAIDAADGSLTHVGTQPSMGVNPAFVSIDATGAYVLAANHGDYVPAVRVATTGGSPRLEKLYDDGTVTALPVQPDGLLGPPTDVAVLERLGGVDPVSQRSPHAHSVNFDPGNRFVLVCDKGADRVYTFRLDRASGRLMDRKVFPTRAGISPRHSAFHPRLPCVYVVHERESSIAVYRYTGDADLELVDTVATIPATFTARNSPADIRVHPGGRFVYASNRGHDSLAIYEVDGGSGQLTSLGNVPCGGTTPRGINLDPSGRYLYAANQGSNNVAVFTVDTDTGALASTGMGAGVLKPACIQFLET
jgi:6-phosphogluconolactonase